MLIFFVVSTFASSSSSAASIRASASHAAVPHAHHNGTHRRARCAQFSARARCLRTRKTSCNLEGNKLKALSFYIYRRRPIHRRCRKMRARALRWWKIVFFSTARHRKDARGRERLQKHFAYNYVLKFVRSTKTPSQEMKNGRCCKKMCAFLLAAHKFHLALSSRKVMVIRIAKHRSLFFFGRCSGNSCGKYNSNAVKWHNTERKRIPKIHFRCRLVNRGL